MPKTTRSGKAKQSEVPDTLKRSPAKAQRTFAKAHDQAAEQYGEGERAHRVEVNDDVRAREALSQRGRIADVALPVFHLGPPVLARIEWAPRDADDATHALLRLQQGNQAKAEGASGTRDRD